jgi:CubicO group peptidase (beta-lactamase class C family)
MRSNFRVDMLALPALFTLVLTIASGGSAAHEAAPSSPPAAPSPAEDSAVPIPPGRVEQAVAQLDRLADGIMRHSGIPGMSVAVVHGGKVVYAKGFGVRKVGAAARVDADTVFQLASVSKPIAATVVAHEVGAGKIKWTTPVIASLPWFALADPYVSTHVTVGDLFSHRSGLPEHAGDLLEDLGYGRQEVLQRLRLLPLEPFRAHYDYTNFGLTAAAEAVAVASGRDWARLSEEAIYRPLGMSSTSSRFADYKARSNRAVTHVKRDGTYVPGEERDPDAQSPAGGVSSSANDMAKWLAFLLAGGKGGAGRADETAALLDAMSPHMVSRAPANFRERASHYGYGFNVGVSPSGRVTASHSGAFALGAATAFTVIPSADVGIVVLTNASPIGMPEALAAQFTDLVQFGRLQRDWVPLFEGYLAPLLAPAGSLVGVPRPTHPAPPRPNAAYAGTYQNAYYGPLQVVDKGGALELRLGPRPTVFRLTHWDGDVFTFTPTGENAPPGTISKASFSEGRVVLEYFDGEGLGILLR